MDKNQRILLVEDDVINRVALCRFLSKQGHVVHPAKDGDEALEIYAKNKFDLIIMDLVMPGIDGAETARKMRFISNCAIRSKSAGEFGRNRPPNSVETGRVIRLKSATFSAFPD